jgi:uncharacterized protein (DUF1330 family)
MLELLRFKGGASGEGRAAFQQYADELAVDLLPRVGGRVMLSGYGRTVIGKQDFHLLMLIEFPSPQAFLDLQSDPGHAAVEQHRIRGVEAHYSIPITAGFFRIDSPAPTPSREATMFTPEGAAATPSGLVGDAVAGARVGETSSTAEQARGFVRDTVIGDGEKVWHLNLLKFKTADAMATGGGSSAGSGSGSGSGSGKEEYGKYARAMGGKRGILSEFGGRSTVAASCYRSLAGPVDFDQAIIVEYPSKHHYLTMATTPEYLEASRHRHPALESTYIVSVVPEMVELHA